MVTNAKRAKKKIAPYRAIAAQLRTWRNAVGQLLGTEYTQGHVAAACDVALSTVQSWEQGWRRPGRGIDLAKFADAYGVPLAQVQQLLGGANRG